VLYSWNGHESDCKVAFFAITYFLDLAERAWKIRDDVYFYSFVQIHSCIIYSKIGAAELLQNEMIFKRVLPHVVY
jgi:hypothetical protein